MNRVRVLLAEDHAAVRQGLRVLLEAQEDITVAGEAETGRQALQLTKKLLPYQHQDSGETPLAAMQTSSACCEKSVVKINPKT